MSTSTRIIDGSGHANTAHSPFRTRFLLTTIILLATVLQKIALPGTDGTLPISTVLVPLLVWAGWLSGDLSLNVGAFFCYCAFVAVGSASFVFNGASEAVSLNSLLLVATVQSSILFEAKRESDFSYGAHLFRDLMFVLSVLGILQYTMQSVVGKELAYFMEYKVPESLTLSAIAYNKAYPIYYGATSLKSNGVFFAEPSFFSQFVALAVIVELLTLKRVLRLTVFCLALLFSYSGTGMLVLALAGGYWLFRNGKVLYIVVGLCALVVVSIFGSALEIDAITKRTDEFVTPNSSGYARFATPIILVNTVSLASLSSSLIGMGPGTIYTYSYLFSVEIFDPTWAKLVFEYGLFGFLAYALMLRYSLMGCDRLVGFSLLTAYFFGGGYLASGTLVSVILVLGVFSKKKFGRNAA
jgi:hypothetical protein